MITSKEPFFYISNEDSQTITADPFHIFAKTDALIQYAGEHDLGILHFWRLQDTIILGMMDTKLPFLSLGLKSLNQAKQHYFVRNSGGLAVFADDGVLNVSLILPDDQTEKLTINAAYEIMQELISKALAPYTDQIKAFEVPTSYCPGDYDLSIAGRKFAGIAQRRVRGGLAIMLYLSVCGPQQKRGEIIRDFYRTGLQGTETKWDFPDVDPKIMANLDELLGVELTVPQVTEMLQVALNELFPKVDTSSEINQILADEKFQKNYQKAYENMIKRNEQLIPTKKEVE